MAALATCHAPGAAPDLAQRIGAWAHEFSPSPSRLSRIRASVHDFMGCVVAGTRRPELRAALWMANGGGVPVWGLSDSFDPAGAALVTGTAGSLLQLHDFYSPGASHPSAPVIAAAWSALHSDNRPRFGAFLPAVAAGYEVANRIAAACYPAQLLAGSTPTATAGSIGAAVAAALIRGLDRDGIARAISNAAFLLPAGPLAAMRAHGDLVPLHNGLAARAGYESANLAREAGAGLHILEGDEQGPGLLGLLGGDPSALEPEEWRGETIDAVGWKFFPACLATHVALEAVLRMESVDPDSLRRVVVRQPQTLLDIIVSAGPLHGGLYDRLMSTRWVVARALEQHRFDYPGAIVENSHTTALARRIELISDKSLETYLPDTLCATVELHTDAGVRLIEYRRPTGKDPETPGPRGWTTAIDELALKKKFDSLVAGSSAIIQSLGALGMD